MALNNAAFLRLQAARVIAQMRWPYVSTLIFSMPMVEISSAAMPTMAVDASWRLYYNPEFVMRESAETLATVFLHECMHCLLSHAPRFESLGAGANPLLWNVAGDCSINATLDDASMPWTRSMNPVKIENFKSIGMKDGMTTESMYALLLGNADAVHLVLDCGSALDADGRSYELAPADPQAPGMSAERQGILLDRLASDISAHHRANGAIPEGLLRWAEEHLDSRIDWRRILGVRLRGAVANEAGPRDYSYVRPSRRQHGMRQQGLELVLPAMRQPRPPSVAVVVDTSGSISDAELRQCISEVAGIARAVGVGQGLWVVPCDSLVGKIQRLRSVGSVESLELHGGGGTDMRNGIDAGLNIRPTPQVVVVITDGYTPWPAQRPRKMQHGIVVLSVGHTVKDVPEWMTTVVIDS